MAVRRAALSDVLQWRLVEERPSVEHSCVWGPVLQDEACAAGCIRSAASTVIIPRVPPSILAAARQCVPPEVLPRVDDTRDSLAARLGDSLFLDDAHVLNRGNGSRGATGKRRRLNASCHAAPRRKSWSVVVRGPHVDEDGDRVVSLFNYSAYGRLAHDVRCEPMPAPVFSLGEQLWLAAMPYLSEASQRNPPTHCQLLLYYCLFESRMGRHRDNYTVRHLRALLESGSAEGSPQANMENSQRMGSEVLLYTDGTAPMDFILTFPPCTALGADIKQYLTRSAFTVQLERGTLMIWKDIDDQFFCHEAEFRKAVLALVGSSGYRSCYVFRWCTSVKIFKSAPECNYKSSVSPPDHVVDV